MKLALVSLLVFLAGGAVQAVDLTTLGSGEQIGAQASYGVDEQGTWDWDEAWQRSGAFTPVGSHLKSFGYTTHTLWFRIDWSLPRLSSVQLYLASWLIHLDTFQIRFRDDGGWIGTTRHLGAGEKNEFPRLAPLSVEFPRLDHGSLLVKISSVTNIQFDSRVYDLAHLTWARVGAAVFFGGTIGFLLLMCLFGLFVGIRLEDRLFLWYSVYVATMLAFLLEYSGFLQSLFPDLLGLEDVLDQPINALVFLMAAVFAYKANVATHRRIAWPLFYTVGTVILFGLVIGLVGNRQFALQWASWVLLTLSLFIEIGAIVQVARGRRFSRFFIVGWSILLLSACWVALGTNGVPGPWGDIVGDSFSLLAGVVVENIIVIAAMADRVSHVYQELDLQRNRAARADRMASIGVMTAQVGHEINTPNHVIVLKTALLDSLRNQAETMLDEPDPEVFRQILRDIQPQIQGIREASSQIHKVIQDLGMATSQTSKHVRVDLGALVRRMGILYNSVWRERSRRLTIRTASVGTLILGIEYRLHQLIVNLVNNGLAALDHPDKSLSILINTAPGEVHLTVTDQGRGMTPEVLAKLGKIFFTTRHNEGGTGLGWRLCQEIAREHSARIEVASIPERGTTVMVRFPTY